MGVKVGAYDSGGFHINPYRTSMTRVRGLSHLCALSLLCFTLVKEWGIFEADGGRWMDGIFPWPRDALLEFWIPPYWHHDGS